MNACHCRILRDRRAGPGTDARAGEPFGNAMNTLRITLSDGDEVFIEPHETPDFIGVVGVRLVLYSHNAPRGCVRLNQHEAREVRAGLDAALREIRKRKR